ncbi:polygalacturonase [Prolixibacteraceae bacterium JC049]|nr:polygalacturonase [Prolixibacteraceae bacterium JC049]
MKKILFFLAFAVATVAVNAKEYNIVKYGAKNDTTKLSTKAINKAVEDCYKNGGGTVVVPAGMFKSGTITLKDNVELHLAHGATLYASTDQNDFPRQKRPEYRSQKDIGGWYSLIYAEGATNIAITGSGTIDGQGKYQKGRPECAGGDKDGRARNILFISCNHVRVEGITMINSGIWNQHYLNCEDVYLLNQRVWNHCNRNNDAIDIDGCRRVIVSGGIYDSSDDAITIKSTGPAPTEHVSITNCVISTHCNAIKCGTESTGGFRNLSISNCTVKPSIAKKKHAGRWEGITALSLEIVDGGIMEGVSVSNLTVDETKCPIYIRLGNRARKHKKDAPTPPQGQLRNVTISNVTAYNTGNFSSSISGIPGGVIENVMLNNILFVNKGGLKAGEYKASLKDVGYKERSYPQPTMWNELPCSGLFVRFVKNIQVNGISFVSQEKDPRPVLLLDDVKQGRFTQITTSENSVPVALTHNVEDVVIEKTLEQKSAL